MDTQYPSSREEAKRLESKFYFTGEPCKRGHIALRKVAEACVECAREDAKASNSKRARYFREYYALPEVKERLHEW